MKESMLFSKVAKGINLAKGTSGAGVSDPSLLCLCITCINCRNMVGIVLWYAIASEWARGILPAKSFHPTRGSGSFLLVILFFDVDVGDGEVVAPTDGGAIAVAAAAACACKLLLSVMQQFTRLLIAATSRIRAASRRRSRSARMSSTFVFSGLLCAIPRASAICVVPRSVLFNPWTPWQCGRLRF